KREGTAQPVRYDELLRNLPGALVVQVRDDDVGAALGENTSGGAADPAGTAGDESNATGELSAGRSLRELVSLERPVLDRERLALAERAEAPERVGGVLDGDRAVVQVPRESRTSRIRAGGHDPDTRHEHDPRPGRIHREGPRLVVEVALVVPAVPLRVLCDSA